MHKFIIFFFFVAISFQLQSQDLKTYSFNFDKTPLKDVLLEIESKTNYSLYFIETWVEDISISENINDLNINEILDLITRNTSLNYEIIEDKIILTLGNRIISKLPENFFLGDTIKTITKPQEPILFTESPADINNGVETVVISKQRDKNTNSTFTLKGKAFNATSGEPISNLTIKVNGRNTFTTTDLDGNYSIILNKGENLITARAMGIKTLSKRFLIYGDGSYDFKLNENIESLSEVYINTRAQANIRETLAGVSRIETQDIKTIPLVLGERDILKVATTLPGISTAGEAAIGFNVRGGKADQNLFLLDGGSIYNPTHFFGIFSAINPFTSDAAEIFKGSLPAKYGGRLASVFDISTKDPSKEKFKGEVSIGPVTGNVTLETPVVKNKSGLILGIRATYSDWILNNLDNPNLRNSKASFYDVIAKYHHKIDDKNDVSITGYYSNDLFNITIDSVFSYSNTLASVNWNRELNENTRSQLKLAHSRYEFGIEFDAKASNDFNFDFDLQETEIGYNINHLLNEHHRLEFGISSKLYAINPGRIRPIGEDSSVIPFSVSNENGLESALFISDKWTPHKKISISAGLRFSTFNFLGEARQRNYLPNLPLSDANVTGVDEFDNNEIVETYTGPEIRLSARYLFNNSFSMRAAYNSTLQYIHTLSNNTTASPIDTWKLSDRYIEPQRSEQLSLGFFKNLEGTKYELSAEAYYKNLDNTLDYKVGGQLLLNEFVETEVLQGDGKAYGVEFLLKKNDGDLTGYLGYSYSRTFYRLDSPFSEERINRGEFFPANFDIPHELSLILNYKLTERYSFSGNFIYQTGRPVTFPLGQFQEGGSNYVLFSDRNQFRIPDYFRVDLGINIEGNHKIEKFAHSFWNISIYNVLGRNNPYSTFFVTDNGEVKAFQSSIFTVPIPTITYNFKF